MTDHPEARMRALLLDYQPRGLRVGHAETPQQDPQHEVLLRIVEIGVCGTDRGLADYKFGAPPTGQQSLILGHEALAVVVKAPPKSGLKRGQYVVPVVRRACLAGCRNCRRKRRDICLTGTYAERGILGAHGYAAQWAVDRPEDLIAVPAKVADVAILVEPLSVVVKALELIKRHGPVGHNRPGPKQTGRKHMLVLGAGPIGLLGAAAAIHAGWRVTVHSREDSQTLAAKQARAIGATYTDRWPTESVSAILEACGSGAVAANAIPLLEQGGVLMLLGAGQATVDFPFLELILRNALVVGSVNSSHQHFQQAAMLLQELPQPWLAKLLHRASFDAAPESILRPTGQAIKRVHRLV